MKHPEGTSKRRKELDIQRRRRKLFNATLYQLLRTIIAVYREGGRVVACADGNMRKIVPVLAMWVTDRQEHEHINQVPAHGCFHCIEGDDGTRRVRTANDTKEQVLETIRTGNTPAHDDCNLPLIGDGHTHRSARGGIGGSLHLGFQGTWRLHRLQFVVGGVWCRHQLYLQVQMSSRKCTVCHHSDGVLTGLMCW